MNYKTKCGIAAGVFAALSATTSSIAWAQNADDAVLLDTLVIGNQEDATGPLNGDKNPPTVTGSKFPVRVNEIPQSVSVLGEEELERLDAKTVSEVLRYTAGVTTDVFGNDGDYDWLRIRGFQADQTGVYLDNAQNLAFAFGSFYIDPYTLGRIEVLRGPSSALYGGSNPGGLVNYVSKRPGGRIRETNVGISDAAAAWFEFDYGDDFTSLDGSYRVTGRLEGGDKYDDFNHGVRGTIAPSVKFTNGNGTEFTLLANVHIADEQHNGSTFLPYVGTVVEAPDFGFIDDDANFSDPDWDSYRRDQAFVSGIVEHEFDNGFNFTGVFRGGVASVEESYYYPFGYQGFSTTPSDPEGTLSLVAFEHDSLARSAQTDLRYYGTVDAGNVSHDLLVGLDARYYWIDEVQASGGGTNTVVDPTDPGTPVLGAPYQDAISTQKQVGIYAQDQIRFGNGWITTLNGRYDYVESDQDGTGAFERTDGEFSYRVGLGYEFENGITPYVSYASFFNPLLVSPANGVNEPETGEQIEAGVKWAPEDGNFSLAAAVFQIDRENVVAGAFPNFNQLGEVRTTGAELEGSYDFANGLSLFASATVLDAETTDNSNAALIGTTPTLIPDYQLSLYAEYDFSGQFDGLKIGGGVRHVGESYANASNTLKVDDFTLLDAAVSYEFENGLKSQLSVKNLTDERHVTGCQTEYVCSYGAGREISFTIGRKW